jgi:hypothetical protein
MKKIYFKFLLLFFLTFFSTQVFACNIKFRNFGSSPDSLKINPPPLTIPDPLGGFNILTSISSLCPQNKELFGTMVSLFYINNELVEIRLERYNKNDRVLMELGIARYGDFKRSLGIDRNKWQGAHTWQNSSEIINYLATPIQGGSTEKLNITSKTHINKISDYFLRKEQWKK